MSKSKSPIIPDFEDGELTQEAIGLLFSSEAYKSRLSNLEELITRREQNIINVFGPTLGGKSMMIRQCSFNLRPRFGFRFLWFDVPRLEHPRSTVETYINVYGKGKSDFRIVAVINDAEGITLKELRLITLRLLNWKRVKSVILLSRQAVPLPNVFHFEVPPPEGKLYGLREQIVTPQKQIISALAPIIITTNEAIIKKLKREPAGLYKLSSRQFEEVIADLLKGMGMEVELTPETRDGGKDILAYLQTPLGKILTLVEAKRHDKQRPVGVGLIRTLYGTLEDHQATNAMLVTTSRFAKPAQLFQERHKYELSLKDYSDVVSWILNHRSR
ncbi:MAG TPA: restriction endonuclease [Pyrinomonadaceae bacterium]|nr:restriction endonuclease [Pyrinomonadaceae bacterium]